MKETKEKTENINWRYVIFKDWNTKDIVQNFGVIVAIIISVFSLWQSKQSIDIARQEKEIRINITASELDDNPVNFYPFPQGDFFPFPGTTGFLSVDIQLEIDNLSERKVSIKTINATPILEDPEDGVMTPFWTNGEAITTDFNGTFQTSTSTGLVNTAMPIALEPGESIIIIGTVGWPLDPYISSILSQTFSTDQEFTLFEIKYVLAKNRTSIGRVEVDAVLDANGELLAPPRFMGQSKLIYRIDIFTSHNTRHSTYLESSKDLIKGPRSNWELLIPDETNNH